MCGICGIYDLSGRSVEPGTIAAMTRTIEHRGPDDEGSFLDRSIGFGFRRLSIVDLAAGAQPMSNEDGSVWIVFNGEIYNHGALRPWLESRGHRFRTNADTEVIVHLYEEVGTEAFELLQGMFGVAIWDAKRRRLVLARDRFGIKPLYWTRDDGRIVFGSEIKAMLPALRSRPEVNTDDLAEFMSFGFLAGASTMFRGVRAVLPGHIMTFGPEGETDDGFFTPPIFEPYPAGAEYRYTDEEWLSNIRNALDIAIRQRFMSDVSFGVLLSGGVDSSLLTVRGQAMRDCETLDSYSIRMQPPATDEGPFAEAVSRLAGTSHHEVHAGGIDVARSLYQMAWYSDEPMCFDNGLWINVVCNLAAQNGEKVLLSGEGADELFGGYVRYQSVLQYYNSLPREPGFRPLTERALAAQGVEGFTGLLGQREALVLGSAVHSAAKVARLLGTMDWKNPYRAEIADRAVALNDPVRSLMAYDQATRLVALLYRMDKMGMAAGVEVRVPFLDHRLAEMLAGVPSRHFIGQSEAGIETKRILKRLALLEGIPRHVVYRQKVGLDTPMSEWLKDREGLGGMLDNLLARQGRGCFDPDVIRELRKRHEQGVEDSRVVLWFLVSFEMWAQHFLDN